MRTQNGEDGQEIIFIRFSNDTPHISKIEYLLTPNQILFLDHIRGHGKDALIESLHSVHDSIAYVSDEKVYKQLKDVLLT